MLEGLDSNSNKADKLVNVLQTTLDAHTNPEAYLQEVCSALKEKGQKQIVDVVNELEHALVQAINSSSASIPIDEPEDTLSAADGTQEKIEKWLKDGQVELKVTRINMHGAPGAGKTCSLHLILNEPPPSSTDSTSIAVQATRISINGGNQMWERVRTEDLLNQLASHLEEALASTDDVPDHSDELSLEEPTKEKPTDMEVIKQIAHALETGKSKKLSANWVYFIDSGGQPAYRELLPLFTRAAALNIITIDLTKGLDEKYEFQYRISEHEFPIKTKPKYSNRGIVQSTISSEAMLNPIEIPYVSESESDRPNPSHYLILGTRKDDESVTEEKLKQMNKSLISLDLKNVIPNVPGKSVIFPVNTLLPAGSKEREEASVELCTAISNCKVEMTMVLPIRLLNFEISLQREAIKKERSFLTKEEVIEIGRSLRLDESDIDDILQYLHDVTTILYYPKVLPNILFVGPRQILDILSRLIAITSVGHAKLDLIANPPPLAERNSLKKFGLFKRNILKKIGKQFFGTNFKSSHLIKLLKHLHIIAKVENREEGDYFFPCALPSYDKLNPAPTEIQPLLIAWEINERGTTTLAIPQGLFPLTIVRLLKRKDIVELAPDPDPDKPGAEFYRCHDAMSLRVYNEHLVPSLVHIINCYTHIEIRFGGRKESCPLVFKLVTDTIKKSSKHLNVACDHIFAFNCPQNDHCYCIVQEDESSTRCTQCQSQHDVLQQSDDDSYRCWFISRKIEKWLKKGEVELKVTRINMHGAPGAGKTCSKHLLLNEPPPSSTDSTPIACRAVKATRINIDKKNKKWKRVDEKDLLNHLAFHLDDKTENEEMSTKDDDEASISGDENVSDSSDESSMEEPTANELDINKSVKNEQPAVESVQKKSAENKPIETKPVETEIIQDVNNIKKTEKAKLSENWVYFIDSGGQPAYRELLPLFTRAAALNIITIDLTKDLNKKCEFQYRISEHTSIDTDLKYSNLDIIQSTISSEAMLNPIKIPYVDMPKHKSIHAHYLILGTRVDLLGDESVTKEKLRKMNKSLSEYKFDDKVVKQNERQGSIIFPVDTMLLNGPKREAAGASLRKAISNCKVEMTINLPIWLFAFEISLEREAKKKECSFLTRKEVIQIGMSLRLDDESDIHVALQYLHDVTIILYYPAVLPNVIFVDPEPILDVLSRLIAITYLDHDRLDMIADDTEVVERNILIKFGLFGEALLEKIAKKQKIINDDFRLSHMINLLVHLHIITEVRVEDVDFEKEKVHVVTDVKSNKEKIKYFFPCALPSYDKLNDPPTEIQPLLIAWEIKNKGTTTLAIPQGLFPLTIVHLLERKKEEVDFSPDRDSHKFYRYHDAMSLRVYKRYFIDIINRYTHLEIHFRGYKKSYSQIVAEVRELLRKVIKKSSKNLKVEEDNKFIFAFKCPKKETCIVREKDKSKDKSSTNTWCIECVSQCNVLDLENDDSYRCWFSDQLSSPGNKFASLEGQDPPTKKCGVQHTELDTSNLIHILDILKKHGYSGVDYYYLGLRLGLLPPTLDVIKEENKGNVRNGLRECLKAWLEQKDNVKSVGGPTYDTLIQALRDEEVIAVADGIEKDINTKK